jgi:hypothetical protein
MMTVSRQPNGLGRPSPPRTWRIARRHRSPWLEGARGPPCRGRDAVESASRQAVAVFMEGGILQFQSGDHRFGEVLRYGTNGLGYVVQLERHEGRLAAREEPGGGRTSGDDDLPAPWQRVEGCPSTCGSDRGAVSAREVAHRGDGATWIRRCVLVRAPMQRSLAACLLFR